MGEDEFSVSAVLQPWWAITIFSGRPTILTVALSVASELDPADEQASDGSHDYRRQLRRTRIDIHLSWATVDVQ